MSDLLGFGKIISSVGNIADDLITTDEEVMTLKLKAFEIEAGAVQKIHETNIAEAHHRSLFVAGWRPAIGWIGAIGLGYNFIIYPFILWANAIWGFVETPPPMIDSNELWTIITGMLGLGAYRSFEKFKGLTK